MKTTKEMVREMLDNPEFYIPTILNNVKIIDKRLCKSLICKVSNKRQLLHYYQIPFLCKVYGDALLEEKLVAILDIGYKQIEKKKKEIRDVSPYALAENFFRRGDYEKAREYILSAAESGDPKAVNLLELLHKTKKNSFKI